MDYGFQETSEYLDQIHQKRKERDHHLEQLTSWLESKQNSFADLLPSTDDHNASSLESKLNRIQVQSTFLLL